MKHGDLRAAAWTTVFALVIGTPASAVNTVAVTPDITVELSGTVVTDHQVAIDDLMGGIALESFGGSLPAAVEVTAYRDDGASGVLFSVDTPVSLPGGVMAAPEDVVRMQGGLFTLAFDGSAHSVPSGVHVDAITREPGGNLILSFDTTVLVDAITVEDEDLVRFDGAAFTIALDASAVGIDRALDTDGAQSGGPGVWALSFDTDGSVGGVTFADEDVVKVNTSGPTFSLLYDGSAVHPELRSADLRALPEPSTPASLLLGAIALAALSTGRRAVARFTSVPGGK
jgi:hypothetical protein